MTTGIYKIYKKKWVRLAVFLCVAIFLYAFFSGTGLARELENQYPKIPLPDLQQVGFDGGYSLNDIAEGIKKPFDTINPLSGLIYYFFTFSVVIVGIIAFGAIIYTGVMFMTSGARPALRAEAQKRLRNVIFGLALLLGSVILLNTINPELTILNVPPVSWQVSKFEWPSVSGSTVIDLDSLRYGGVVLFAES
ncbi:MAG: hypothetical protein WAP23_01265, partial [Candidatus Spechtbacterales bacterium]